MFRLAAIKVPLADGIRLPVAPESENEPDQDMDTLPFLPAGWKGMSGGEAA